MKYRKHILTSISLALLCLATSSAVVAGTVTTNLSVSATVIPSCSIKANPINWSSYDPTSTAALPIQQAALSLVCTPNSINSTTIGLDSGQGKPCPTTTTRCMTGRLSSDQKLSYELYQPANSISGTQCNTSLPAGGTVWDMTKTLSVGAAPNLAARTYNVCGYLPPSQSVPADTYNDTVVVTVTF